jgi:hypothetical protein
MFEDTARDVARAIKEADAALTPAKIGGSVTHFDDVQQNILGPGTADDGTPAGFPRDHFDDELTVIRFDRADGSRPIAAWANLGMHPESQDTTDLISADFTGMTERLVERSMGRQPGAADGPVVAWSQGSVGDVEPDQSRANPPAAGREYWHRNYAQMELMSRQVAAAVLDTWDDIAAETPDVPEKFVAFTTEVPVGMVDYRFAGPPSHPLPTVSNCRTERPGAPVVGLPNCARADEELDDQLKPPEQYGTTLKLLRDAGVPIPGNYSPTSYGGVQESLRIHLQAIRLGDILLASCPCEPVSDMTLNLKSRADAQDGMNLGYEWPCEERADGVFCNFATAAWLDPDWRQVDPEAYDLMRAQITNPADGWEDDVASLQGEIEATDTTQIYGNYTHREIQDLSCGGSPCEGYTLPVMVGQANDYVGYIVTYREYQRGDHYRKALTAFGPHTSDYINTRLVQMGAELKGGAAPSATLDPVVGPADELIQLAKSMAVGQGGTAGSAAYEAALPDDGGTPATVSEPTSLERFGATTLSWVGGSNYTDNPTVVVQKEGPSGWQTVATQEGGEVVVTLAYDSFLSDAPLLWLTGGKVYAWTATWEAFERTEPGTYRFVVSGHHRSGSTANPYEVTSAAFDVKPWAGIAAHDLTVDPAAGTASFGADGIELTVPEAELETDDDAVLGPDELHYPDTYASDLAYIDSAIEQRGPHRFCWNCTFRPWADSGRIAEALVTVHGSDESTATHPAALQGDRWVASGLVLYNGDVVVVDPRGVTDEFGNVNGSRSNSVTIEGFRDRPGTPPTTVATELTYTGDTSGDIGKKASVDAILTTASGEPVAGRTITFTRGAQSASATTHNDGRAKSKLSVEEPAGDTVPLIVEFAGDDEFSPARIEVPFTAVIKGHRKTSRGLPAVAFGAASAASLLAALVILRAMTGRRRGFNWGRDTI